MKSKRFIYQFLVKIAGSKLSNKYFPVLDLSQTFSESLKNSKNFDRWNNFSINFYTWYYICNLFLQILNQYEESYWNHWVFSFHFSSFLVVEEFPHKNCPDDHKYFITKIVPIVVNSSSKIILILMKSCLQCWLKACHLFL